MGRVICEFSMSLDGYMAGRGVSAATPMGEGGEALHDWMFRPDAGPDNARARRAMVERTGAVILGRRTFDLGLAHWGGTPFPAPTFVLSHRPPPTGVGDGLAGFVFVDRGIDAALRQARAAAGGRDVRLMGAEVTRQYLAAGHVDEIVVQLVPLLLGGGARPFPEGTAPDGIATHLHFSVRR